MTRGSQRPARAQPADDGPEAQGDRDRGDPDHGAHAGGVRREERDAVADVVAAQAGDDDREERADGAGERGDGVDDAVGERREGSAARRPAEAQDGQPQLAAEQEDHADTGQEEAGHGGDVGEVLLRRPRPTGWTSSPKAPKTSTNPAVISTVARHRAPGGRAGARSRARSGRQDDEGEVAGQQREPAGVERRQRAGREGEGQRSGVHRPVGAQPARSATVPASSSSSA